MGGGCKDRAIKEKKLDEKSSDGIKARRERNCFPMQMYQNSWPIWGNNPGVLFVWFWYTWSSALFEIVVLDSTYKQFIAVQRKIVLIY